MNASIRDLTDRFFVNFVYSQCIGLPAWFLIDAPRHLLWPDQRPRLLAFLPIVIGSLLAATYGGTWLGAQLLGHPWSLRTPLTSLLITATAGFLAVLYFWERGRAESIERQIAEARLKLLQAQIEPHFLFNTLANLDALIGIDPARARVMLGHLNDYLRATLASARKERNTLADEFALLDGYLEVIGVRMGPRLSFSLDLPDALKACEVPPMLLQPLVENAIKHGLEPKIEGGRIEIAARAEGRTAGDHHRRYRDRARQQSVPGHRIWVSRTCANGLPRPTAAPLRSKSAPVPEAA